MMDRRPLNYSLVVLLLLPVLLAGLVVGLLLLGVSGPIVGGLVISVGTGLLLGYAYHKLRKDGLQAKLESLFLAMDDVILVLDARGRFLDVAPTNPELLYRPSSEMQGRLLHEVFPAAQADFFLEQIQTVLTTHAPVNVEYQLDIEGRIFCFQARLTPLRHDQVLWMARDNTPQVQMRDALRKNEQLYRALVEQSSDMIYLIQNGRLTLINPAFSEVFGVTMADIQAPDFKLHDLVAPESKALVQQRIDAHNENRYDELNTRYEFTAIDKHGQHIELDALLSYFEFRGEVAVQGILRDITERKKAEAALQQMNIELEQRVTERTAEIHAQHHRTAAILDSVADAVIVIDLDGTIVLANPVARLLLEVDSPTGELMAHVNRMVAQLYEQPASALVDTITLPDEQTYQAKAAPVREADAVLGMVIVLRDITRLRELDEIKTQLVDNVSHELRTPMSNIRLYLALLKRGKPERQAEYMDVLERETLRLDRLISDLLDLSRLESSDRQPPVEWVALDHMTHQVIENVMPQAAEKQLALHAPQAVEALPPMQANRDQLMQVLTNLIGNAVAYTPEGGTITVNLDMADVALQPDATPVPAIRLTVADTGIGIPAEEMDTIFDRFHRSENARQTGAPGTGLGLAITKEIIERHYGRIEVNSILNEGSTFRVTLPVESPVRTSNQQ
jgi:PAS domain S-box-containing protein